MLLLFIFLACNVESVSLEIEKIGIFWAKEFEFNILLMKSVQIEYK